MDATGLERLLNSSITYEIEDGILEITGYYDSNKKIKLDLRKIDNEILDLIKADETEEERWGVNYD